MAPHEYCTFDTCDLSTSLYGYRPSLAANAFFIGTLCLCLIGCVVIAAVTRRYLGFSFLMCMAYSFEVVAFSERINGWRDPWRIPEFGLQVLFSTVAPAFASMSIPILMSNAIRVLGAEHSPISLRRYPRLFIPLDIAAVFIQAVGLAITFADSNPDTQRLGQAGPNAGKYVIATGLAFQTGTMVVELVLFAVACIRASLANRRQGYKAFNTQLSKLQLRTRFRVLLVAVPLIATCLLLWGVYQTLFFVDGLESNFARNETYFTIANGVLLVEAMAALVVFHPSLWLDESPKTPSIKVESAEEVNRHLERAKQKARKAEAQSDHEEISTLLKTHRRSVSSGSMSDLPDDGFDSPTSWPAESPRFSSMSDMSIPIGISISDDNLAAYNPSRGDNV